MTRTMRSLALVVCVAAIAAGCKKAATVETGATGTSGALRVTEMDLGRSLAAGKEIGDRTANFRPADTVYLSVETEGTSSQATLATRWTFQDGQLVKELTETIAPTGKTRTEFHIVKSDGWPAGKYTVAVSLNGAAAGSKEFEVK
jgi:hypothetical protein